MNPYEVGEFEQHEPEAGPLFRLRMSIEILARVFFGIAILGLISFFLACALIFGLPPEN